MFGFGGKAGLVEEGQENSSGAGIALPWEITISLVMLLWISISDGQCRYGNVSESEGFQAAWPGERGLEDARGFIARVEALRKEGKGDLSALEKESRREIEAVIEFCRKKFGDEEVKDASDVWVQPTKETKDIAEKMITGGEGWRKF